MFYAHYLQPLLTNMIYDVVVKIHKYPIASILIEISMENFVYEHINMRKLLSLLCLLIILTTYNKRIVTVYWTTVLPINWILKDRATNIVDLQVTVYES